MLLDDETPQTPLQLKLADTGKTLGIAALFVCLVIFIVPDRLEYSDFIHNIGYAVNKDQFGFYIWEYSW